MIWSEKNYSQTQPKILDQLATMHVVFISLIREA